VQEFDSDGKLLAHFEVVPNPGGIAVRIDLVVDWLDAQPANRPRGAATPF